MSPSAPQFIGRQLVTSDEKRRRPPESGEQ